MKLQVKNQAAERLILDNRRRASRPSSQSSRTRIPKAQICTEIYAFMERLDNNWDSDSFDPQKMTSTVEDIHLCALRNDLNEGDELGNPPTNHWVVCLQTSLTSSVMLDMAPGYGSDGLRGKIEVLALSQPYTDETLRVFSFKPTQTMTTEQFLAYISKKGRQKFTFHPSWEGCRFWISVLMADWEELQLVAAGSASSAKEALTKYWVNPEGSQPREMNEGVFRE